MNNYSPTSNKMSRNYHNAGEKAKSKSMDKTHGDVFRTYMKRKIDLQREQFGLVLPPTPPTPNTQESNNPDNKNENNSKKMSSFSSSSSSLSLSGILKKLKKRHGSPSSPSSSTYNSAPPPPPLKNIQKKRNDLFFRNITILINGHTKPDALTLQRIIQKHGGDVEKYETTRVTHIIAENMSHAKAERYRGRHKKKVCHPDWILECVRVGRLVSCANYLIVRDEGVGDVRKLFQMKEGKELKVTDGDKSTTINEDPENNIIEKNNNETSEIVDTCVDLDKNDAQVETIATHTTRDTATCHHVRTVGNDPNFLSSYFSKSRLSFIGSYRHRLSANQAETATRTSSSSLSGKRFVFHVDMDCFFASVVLRKYPQHKDKPVAIGHGVASGNRLQSSSTSELSTCNYVARGYGVRKGMWLRDALVLCPELVLLPYDFEGYEDVTEQVEDILNRFGRTVEMVSCDEAYVEIINDGSDRDVQQLADTIRREIFETTECTASIGIGSNKFLAKMGTEKAKPNGSYLVKDWMEELRGLMVVDIPGIGRKLGEKLRKCDVTSISDVWRLGEEKMIEILGKGTGKKVWEFCNGRDERKVKMTLRKSIGAECNYGVRFDGPYGPHHMIDNLAKEVQKRMQLANINRGRQITLKLKRRRQNAEEPAKFLGHGLCHNLSKSADFLVCATHDWKPMANVAKRLYDEMKVEKCDVRGMGIVVSKLHGGDMAEDEPDISTFFKGRQDQSIVRDEAMQQNITLATSRQQHQRKKVTGIIRQSSHSINYKKSTTKKDIVSWVKDNQHESPPKPTNSDIVVVDITSPDISSGKKCTLQNTFSPGILSQPPNIDINNNELPSSSPPTNSCDVTSSPTSRSVARDLVHIEPFPTPSKIDEQVFQSLPTNIQNEITASFKHRKTSTTDDVVEIMNNETSDEDALSSNMKRGECAQPDVDDSSSSSSLVEIVEQPPTTDQQSSPASFEASSSSILTSPIALPPLSQIDTSSLEHLPESFRNDIIDQMQRKGRHGKKQETIKRMMKLASYKSKKDHLNSIELEALPLRYQLEMLDNEGEDGGTSNTESKQSQQCQSDDSKNFLSFDSDDEDHSPLPDHHDHMDDVLHVQKWMDSCPHPEFEDIAKLKDFLQICHDEKRMETVVVLLRMIKGRKDGWKDVLEEILKDIDKMWEKDGRQLDKRWLGL